MRLFTKIFLCGTLVFGLAFSVSGYFLLHYSMQSSVAREVDFALNQYQYDKFTVQSALLTMRVTVGIVGDFPSEEDSVIYIWQAAPGGKELWEGEVFHNGQIFTEGVFAELAEEISAPLAFYSENKELLYSEIEGLDVSFLSNLAENKHVYRFLNKPEGSFILVGSMLNLNGQDYFYFITQWDISKTIGQQETMQEYFVRFYSLAMTAGMALLGLLSALLTGPLKRMAKAARRMTDGDYEERLTISGRDEIGELAESLNQMAGAVEEKIGELQEAAREKEDFVANFAHELKTPLTSIIGYADMLYQKELPREEVQKASWYIWNEGMRLEALSLKLMDLTVLGRQEFPLQEMPADELLRDVAEGLYPVFLEKKIDLSLQAEQAYIRVDYDLLKTLLINLMDNSMKAGGSRIELTGKVKEGEYWIQVRDNGCGMQEEELSRITEAFYMVDKARSRKQHGAGLGLALAERIARLHGSELVFESRKGEGTEVSFHLKCEKGGTEDGEEI